MSKRNKTKLFITATPRQRLYAALVFLLIAAVFTFLGLAAHNIINLNLILSPCGFKQRFNLPCPTCGFTTAAIHFVNADFANAFYIQPASAFLCSIISFLAFFAFITAVFGVYFTFLQRACNVIKAKHIILALIIIIVAGWAVTLARALANN